MLKLRFPWVWWSFGWVLVAGVVFGSLLPGPLVATVGVNDKFEHAGAYFALTLWLAGLVVRRRYAWAALAAFALGAALEAAQGLLTVTREAEGLDLVANGAGIVFALALAYLGLGGWAGRVERMLGAGS